MLFSRCLVPAVVVVRLQLEALVVVVVELEVVEVDRAARAASARRRWRSGGGLLAAALGAAAMVAGAPVAVRLALFGHQLPVDDRVRVALPCEARAPDGRVDGVSG